MAFFTPFLERNPVRDIQVIRTVEDGNMSSAMPIRT